jgi:hypothetical protein
MKKSSQGKDDDKQNNRCNYWFLSLGISVPNDANLNHLLNRSIDGQKKSSAN